jgi:hypothetical protein
LDPIEDAMTLAKVSYLRSQNDLELRLEKCDATDAKQMNLLLRSFSLPIAGCFHVALVLSDALFFQQTFETFQSVYDSKLRIFEVFSAQVEIESLDFFVAFSSFSGLLGIMGQSNYARFVLISPSGYSLIFLSACTAMEGALERYPNAFSLITPGISDAGYLVSRLHD